MRKKRRVSNNTHTHIHLPNSPYTISLTPFPGPNRPKLQLFFLSPLFLSSTLSPLSLATNSLTGLRLLSIPPTSALSNSPALGTPRLSNVGVREGG